MHLSSAILPKEISHPSVLLGILQRDQLVECADESIADHGHDGQRHGEQEIVSADVTDDWIAKVRDFVKNFYKAHGDIRKLLNKNRIFIDRTKGIGILSKEDAINMSVTGPLARSRQRRGSRSSEG